MAKNVQAAQVVEQDSNEKNMKNFEASLKKFHTSPKNEADYVALFQDFEKYCGIATWGEIRATIQYSLLDMMSMGGTRG